MPRITFVGKKRSHTSVSRYRWRDGRGEGTPIHPSPAPAAPGTRQRPLLELDALTGLGRVKEMVREIAAYARIQKMRQAHQLRNESLVLHMVFKGNPGTGKTTVARILGNYFRDIGILPRGHLVEIERADLVGEYIGHTAQKTRVQVKKALGGILFIDEAYSLARGGEKDFGREAIDTLVKAAEDHKNELIVILAGYKKEMELFMLSNPGLQSRFPIQITFSDYSLDELMEIAEQMAREREYSLSTSAKGYLRSYLGEVSTLNLNFSNARLVRNLIEKALRKQAVRLVDSHEPSRNQLMTLEKVDVRKGYHEDPGEKFIITEPAGNAFLEDGDMIE